MTLLMSNVDLADESRLTPKLEFIMKLLAHITRAARVLSRATVTSSCFLAVNAAYAAGLSSDVVGAWKVVSHTVTMDGQTFDAQAALLQQRPCASKILYKVNADGTYRLDASASGCDDKYKAIQEKLYAKTKWKLEGNKITTSASNFAVGQTYTVSVSGNRMTWIGTDGQGTLVFQR